MVEHYPKILPKSLQARKKPLPHTTKIAFGYGFKKKDLKRTFRTINPVKMLNLKKIFLKEYTCNKWIYGEKTMQL